MGSTNGCSVSGGVSQIYIGNFDSGQTFIPDAVTGIITTFTQNPSPAVGVTPGVWKFDMEAEWSGLEGTGNFSLENGTIFYESKLSMQFSHLDNELRTILMQLGKAPLYAIIQSTEGDWYVLGDLIAGRTSASTATLGKTMGDLNGATMEITFKSKEPLKLIDNALLVPSATATPTDIPVN